VAGVRHSLDAHEIRGRTRPVTATREAPEAPEPLRDTAEPVDGAIRRAQHTLATVERARQAEQARAQQQARWHTDELRAIANLDNARSEVTR